MPGAVPCTSTLALTNATLPYALRLAGKGWRTACSECPELRGGLNIAQGRVVYKKVSEAWALPFTDVQEVLSGDCGPFSAG
jgi:alanine dehydrogenase